MNPAVQDSLPAADRRKTQDFYSNCPGSSDNYSPAFFVLRITGVHLVLVDRAARLENAFRHHAQIHVHDVQSQYLYFLVRGEAAVIYSSNNENTYVSRLEPLGMKLAKFILKYETMGIFTYNMTTVAHILNVSYRHLMRMLKRFCDTGILKKGSQSYVILDRRRLEQFRHEFSENGL